MQDGVWIILSGSCKFPFALADRICFPICHCEAPTGPWRPEREARGSALGVQSREGTADANQLPIKWYAPIASVAAVTAQPLAALPPYGCGVPFTGSDRLAGWQCLQRKFIGAMPSSLSLRGGRRPTWQSRSTRPDHRKAIGENATAFPRLPRRFAPRNDTSGECRSAPAPSCGLMILYKALTERRYRRNRFSRFYRQPVRIGSIAPGGVYPSPTIIYDFPYSLSYGCISRNSPGVRPVSLRNALAKAVEDGKPHSAEICRTVSSVPRSRTLAFASRRRTMRA